MQLNDRIRILDVGSGLTGGFVHKYTASSRHEICHVDISKDAFHLEAQCDGYRLPFLDSKFDMVYAAHILEHLEKPIEFLRELQRVSKMYVVIRVPNATHWRAGTLAFSPAKITKDMERKMKDQQPHIFSWDQYTLKSLCLKIFPEVDVKQTYRLFDWAEPKNPIRRKLGVLKRLILSYFIGKNELTAICAK